MTNQLQIHIGGAPPIDVDAADSVTADMVDTIGAVMSTDVDTPISDNLADMVRTAVAPLGRGRHNLAPAIRSAIAANLPTLFAAWTDAGSDPMAVHNRTEAVLSIVAEKAERPERSTLTDAQRDAIGAASLLCAASTMVGDIDVDGATIGADDITALASFVLSAADVGADDVDADAALARIEKLADDAAKALRGQRSGSRCDHHDDGGPWRCVADAVADRGGPVSIAELSTMVPHKGGAIGAHWLRLVGDAVGLEGHRSDTSIVSEWLDDGGAVPIDATDPNHDMRACVIVTDGGADVRGFAPMA